MNLSFLLNEMDSFFQIRKRNLNDLMILNIEWYWSCCDFVKYYCATNVPGLISGASCLNFERWNIVRFILKCFCITRRAGEWTYLLLESAINFHSAWKRWEIFSMNKSGVLEDWSLTFTTTTRISNFSFSLFYWTSNVSLRWRKFSKSWRFRLTFDAQ